MLIVATFVMVAAQLYKYVTQLLNAKPLFSESSERQGFEANYERFGGRAAAPH